MDGVATTFLASNISIHPSRSRHQRSGAKRFGGRGAHDSGGRWPRNHRCSYCARDPGGYRAAPGSVAPFAQAVGLGRSGFVTISALGEVFSSPNYFTVTYIGQDKEYLDSLTIDGQKPG